MTNWKPPIDHTVSGIDTEIIHENENKVVIEHTRIYDPQYGSSYTDSMRKEVIVRHNGNVTVNEITQSHKADSGKLEIVNEYSHTFELADDNETVPHSGKEWKQHYLNQSRKCVNLRWESLRENKPDPKTTTEIVKQKIESQY